MNVLDHDGDQTTSPHAMECACTGRPVGEVHFTEKMLALGLASEGREWGIIVPEVNPGRVRSSEWLFGSPRWRRENAKVSDLAARFLRPSCGKRNIEAKDVTGIVPCREIREEFPGREGETVDGLKLLFDDGWVHVRNRTRSRCQTSRRRREPRTESRISSASRGCHRGGARSASKPRSSISCAGSSDTSDRPPFFPLIEG